MALAAPPLCGPAWLEKVSRRLLALCRCGCRSGGTIIGVKNPPLRDKIGMNSDRSLKEGSRSASNPETETQLTERVRAQAWKLASVF